MTRFYYDIAMLEVRELIQRLVDGIPLDQLTDSNEWLAIVEQLTEKIRLNCRSFSSQDWQRASIALEKAFETGESVGAFDHNRGLARRLNLTWALLQQVEPNEGIDILNPGHAAATYLREVSMTAKQARELAANRQPLDESFLTLRNIKEILKPIVGIRSICRIDRYEAELDEWEQVLPLLP
ncbi:hypothetical protein [Nocardia transvalensis]|uniref:hypothetical protein n=1 Tax=Nocardia transvalensis TaxID=37333 RepID=UPI001894AA43|nr:hypothetical protein [Nocardia transvalensis]MBF6327469.1 hypothetical protein [Nocardia transvalensis]